MNTTIINMLHRLLHAASQRLNTRHKQWLWFVALWCGGFGAVFLLAQLIRLAMGL